MKKVLKLILFMLPWFFFLIFLRQNGFVKSIIRPIPLPFWLFLIITLVSIFFITFNLLFIHKEYSKAELKEYDRYFLVYYLFFQGIFFSLTLMENIFISFSCAVITVLASLFLYYESKSFHVYSSKKLQFPILYNIGITILLLITYFMNL